MFGKVGAFCVSLLLAMLVVLHAGRSATAQDAVWRVSKSSGEVSVTTAAGERTALIAGATLQPGDNIRTGQNGRVLLMRGEESILVSPNSAIGIPKPRADGRAEGLPTSIIQQSGSILLEVEKRNVKHFQVETPYLAAVVKGTQFRVTVENGASRVDVLRGQVEVSDFKSGQYALVAPGQVAEAFAQGFKGLSLSGSGTLSPVQQGPPPRFIGEPVAGSCCIRHAQPVWTEGCCGAVSQRDGVAPYVVARQQRQQRRLGFRFFNRRVRQFAWPPQPQ
jgi:hypothetical protein